MTNLTQTMSTHTPATSALVIGFSVQGRPLVVRQFGDPEAPLRILFVTGQHGDERAIRRALCDFVAAHTAAMRVNFPGLQLAILEDANPDGAALRTRENAQGVDLNRDHLLLRAPESRAIHRFVDGWRPHLVVDLHNYPARRQHLVEKRVRLAWDVCLDFPSHPATGLSGGHPLIDSLMQWLDARLSAAGFCFGRYTIVREGRGVRHGTPDPVDARNVLSLRYGVPTLLLEARNPQQAEAGRLRRNLRNSAVQACAEILRWANTNMEAVVRFRADGGKDERVPLRLRRRRVAHGVEIPTVDLDTGTAGTLPFPEYRPVAEGRRHVTAPWAYAIPLSEREILRVLAAQGFYATAAKHEQLFRVEEACFPEDACGVDTRKTRGVRFPRVSYERSLQGFALFPFAQQGGRLLALLLESESRYALHGNGEVSIRSKPGSVYPVRRVMEACGPAGCQLPTEVLP